MEKPAVKKRSILIVEDHPLFREGLISFLSRHNGYNVIGEAANGEECLRKAEELHPDLVILDISLPDIDGIDATRQIRASLPDIRVVILSVHSKVDFVTEAFKAGASGYVTKDSAGEKLTECLDAVFQGEYYMDRTVSHNVIKNLLMRGEDGGLSVDPVCGRLTTREQEVVRSIAQGLSAKQTAEKLCISQKTVENHRARIFQKLKLHSTLDLIRYAAKHGLINIDLWKE